MQFFKRFNSRWVILAGVAAAVIVLIVVVRTVLASGTSTEGPVPTVASQVYAVALQPSVPDSMLPEKESDGAEQPAPSANSNQTGEEALTVSNIALSEFIALLDDPYATVSNAAINQTLSVTAAAIQEKDASEPTIYATTYVEDRLPIIMGAYTEHNTDVVATATSRTTSTAVPGRYPYTPGTTAAATGGGFNWFGAILIFMIVTVAALYIMRYVMFRREQNKSNNSHDEVDTRPDTRFTDVAGCDEAIEELQEIVEFLKNPLKFAHTGAKPRKGALLCGPPGTGKTLLARAVAGEAGVPFYSASGSDFVEMYVGVGAKRVRELFKKARKNPEGAIIFIDEIDAVGRSRSSSSNSNNQETENTLNALLVEMDGFHSSNVIVLGATNRDDMLDKALLRPGRLDRKVHVGLPDRLGRERILQVHAKDKPLSETVDLNLVARRTPGMSGAELEQIVNEACMFAARDNRATVTEEDFDHAVATIAMGKARTSAVVTEHDRLVTAWHEAGHATIGMVLPDAWDVTSISIIPRGPAGGVTWFAEGDDVFLTRRQAFARIVTAMGGRAAEEMLLNGEFTSGPYGDLQQATNTAIAMITKYGMTEHGLAHRPDEILASGSTISDDVWAKADAILAEALDVARATLASHRDLFDALVSGLLEYDTLTASQIEEIRAGKSITPPALPDAPKEYVKPPTTKDGEIRDTRPPGRVSFDEDESDRNSWIPFPGWKRRGRVASAINAAWGELNRPKSQGKRPATR